MERHQMIESIITLLGQADPRELELIYRIIRNLISE